ncbi:MAG: YdcH family protein [Paracoccus sp. (in: a-proteobacteria)]|uniref:YdcH family protein n=1 Tax=Paracoccus sp. TaxID=267 RepID=UPI0026E00397|nr:YdcH family protein [Paracoccus sp. (in: a-proteobacteria)]MDO5622169.1 YdcH family protein [Paracoccus sp. (in: a-proteobacteria)]
MTVENHVEALRKKHEELSKAVEAAQRSPGSDDLDIAAMKKEKLRIKEEISRLS